MLLDGWVFEALRCPACLSKFELHGTEIVGRNVIKGILTCESCGAKYVIQEGMLWGGISYAAAKLREQEMKAEFKWNFELHSIDDHYQYAERSFRVAQDVILKMKRKISNGKILDAGAGTGCHSWQLCKHGYEVLAAELTPEMLATGDCYYDSEIYFERTITDCTILPLANSTFDAVFCKELAHHVEVLQELFLEFRRVLQPGGFLILIEPVRSGRPKFRSKTDAAKEAGLTHQDYTINDYLRALRQSGFVVSELKHYRRPINKKYGVLHNIDSFVQRTFRLDCLTGPSLAKQFRAWLLGGEVALLAEAIGSGPFCSHDRKIEKLEPTRLDVEVTHQAINAMRLKQGKLLPLLKQVHGEHHLSDWQPVE